MAGAGSLNGTYDQEVFTQRAVALIDGHTRTTTATDAAATPFFLYLAYHNVHDTCQGGGTDRLGLNAPAATVARYGTTKLDTWKVQAAMTTELDYGIGNVTVSKYIYIYIYIYIIYISKSVNHTLCHRAVSGFPKWHPKIVV